MVKETNPLNSIRLGAGLVVAAVFVLLVFTDPVMAAPDTPPSVLWEVDLPTPGGTCGETTIQDIESDSSGNIYTYEGVICGGKQNAIVRKLEASSGAVEWQTQIVGVNAGNIFALGHVRIMPDGNLAVLYGENDFLPDARQVVRFVDPDDGSQLGVIGGDAGTWTVDTGTFELGESAISFRVANSTSFVIYVNSGAAVTAVSCASLTTCPNLFETASTTSGTWSNWYADFPLVYYTSDQVCSGSNGCFSQRNATTGAVITTVSITAPDSPRSTPWLSSAGEIVQGMFDDLGGSVRGVGWRTCTDLLGSCADTAPTENQINDGSARDTQAVAYYLDGNDDFYVCGNYVSTGVKAFVAKFSTSTDDQRWNETVPVASSFSSNCIVDGLGNLVWAFTHGTTGATVRKYSGDGASRPFEYGGFDAFPVEEAPVVFEPVDFGSGVANFANDIGFSSVGGLFFFGLILVIILFLIVAGATKGVSDSGEAALIGGSIAGMGTMVFNVTQELWDPVWAVILIILTSAVIVMVTRKLFIAGGE